WSVGHCQPRLVSPARRSSLFGVNLAFGGIEAAAGIIEPIGHLLDHAHQRVGFAGLLTGPLCVLGAGCGGVDRRTYLIESLSSTGEMASDILSAHLVGDRAYR